MFVINNIGFTGNGQIERVRRCFSPAPVLSAFELVVIVVASHWLFGLGLLMTKQAKEKLVSRVGASAAFPLTWH